MNYWNIMNLAFALSNIAYNYFNDLEATLWRKYRDYDDEPPQEYWDAVENKSKSSEACDEVMCLYLKG